MNLRYSSRAAAALLAAFVASPGGTGAQEGGAAPAAASPGGAETSGAAAEEERRKLEEEIQKEMGGATSGRGATGVSKAQPAEPGPPAAPSATGGNPFARLLLLPDVSAIASVTADWNDQTDKVGFAFEELELALQAVVDPYARADVFVSFSDGKADVEEAYLTTLSLPAGLQLRAGRLFSPFGRINQTHPHVQEFIEAPLAHRLLADENLGGAGLVASWLVPLPWFAELQAAAQSTAPTEADEARFTGLARLSQYFPIGAAATLGVGLSAARRDEAAGQFRDLLGGDLYLRIRPPASRAYLALSAELHARRFQGVPGVAEDFEEGWWAQAFERFSPYWGAGLRYERAPAGAMPGDEKRIGAVLAWLPSEFQRIRLEASYDLLPDDTHAVTALLGLEFGIGAHGAHPF